MRLVCPFWGFVNVPPFIALRSDYPLVLTLLGHLYACALTWSYIAELPSVRTIPIPLLRHNHLVPVSIYTGSCANSCSSACAPSASESTWGLTPARASVREFQLHIDERRTPPVEHGRAHLPGNTELDSRELAASLLSPKSAACVVVEAHMLSTSGRHLPITTVLCPAFQMRNSTEGVHFGLSLSGVAVRGQQGKSDQLRRST
jgi:hypothetical protein